MLNLDVTIAITQNFCNEGNFEKVWVELREGRKKLSIRFLERLRESYPHLHDIAVQLNERDGFVMWDKRPDWQESKNGE